MPTYHGKLDAGIKLKSNADKYWKLISDFTTIFPKAFPHDYKSIEVLAGDGRSAGSIRRITYPKGSRLAKSLTQRTDAIDDEKKTLTYSIIEGELLDGDFLEYFSKFQVHIAVIPIGEGAEVKLTAEFTKLQHRISHEMSFRDFANNNFIDVDAYIQQNA